MSRRDVLNSPRLRELKRRRRIGLLRKVFLWVLPFLVLLGALAYVSKLERLNIFEVKVVGNKVIDTEQILEVAKNNLGGRYLWLIPKSNFLLYPESNIRHELQTKFPRLKNISFDVENTKTLIVALS